MTNIYEQTSVGGDSMEIPTSKRGITQPGDNQSVQSFMAYHNTSRRTNKLSRELHFLYYVRTSCP